MEQRGKSDGCQASMLRWNASEEENIVTIRACLRGYSALMNGYSGRDAEAVSATCGRELLAGQQALVPIEDGLPEEEGDDRSTDKKRPERDIVLPLDHASGNKGDSDKRP